uniref:Uncharacterized protein n=1 Tax=Parascaris equorum TaxID=6256 RepID=A0A914RK70_PAREQ
MIVRCFVVCEAKDFADFSAQKEEEKPVSRPIEQLSSMLVHSLDHDEFRSVLSYVSKPRYSTMNTIKKFDYDARRMDGAGDKEVEDEEGKISVKTGLILREIQRVAEEKQRTEDIG